MHRLGDHHAAADRPLGVILACWIFNILGMRPAVWFSYVTGAMMLLPVVVIAFGAFVTGDFNNHPST